MGRSGVYLWGIFLLFCGVGSAGHVELTDTHVVIDEKPAPFLYGAEVQYFRARGGPGRNVPRETVLRSWNLLLDRVREAGMNTVIFYIPWDFHEPVEGTFDFDGTLDQDGDGRPDYPSRDLKTFLKLVRDRGLTNVMVRPGPYINAEWGPEGFGAIPKWFLDRYPQALAITQSPNKPRVASFHHPLYRERVERWFRALYPVLRPYIGPGKNISFLQIDNETNYFWDSVYERDWHPGALARYRSFLKTRYAGDPQKLSAAYGKTAAFDTVEPPRAVVDKKLPGGAWHYDWFLFHDVEIDDYYRFLRKTWETVGISEPDVVFTTCDSFNAPKDGLLPRLDFRQRDRLTLTTMNIYPKTFGTQTESTLNTPMKAAHDAVLVAASHKQFYGTAADWVMSTETVGGWFPPVEVSLATRQHTYGSLVGSGVKALIIYYFHEGWNWTGLEKDDSELHFDAPLDKDLQPRPSFALLKSFGRAIADGLGETLLDAKAHNAPVLIARDSRAQYPLSSEVNVQEVVSTDAASLFGFLREAGYPAEIGYLDRMPAQERNRFRAIVWDDPGYASEEFKRSLDGFSGLVVRYGGSSGLPRAFKGWNEDGYVKIPDAAERLSGLRALLSRAGIAPVVRLSTEDGKPFVHAWARRGKDRTLVFVENFAREARQVTVAIPDLSGRWRRIWGGAPVQTEGTSPKLSVGADTLEIWAVDRP